jgi:hypothetical protein
MIRKLKNKRKVSYGLFILLMTIGLFSCSKLPKTENSLKSNDTILDADGDGINDEDENTDGKPSFEFSADLTNGIVVEEMLPAKVQAAKIKITPRKILAPYEDYDRVSHPNCGRGSWEENQVYYDRTKVSWRNVANQLQALLKKELYLKATSVSGVTIEGSLVQMIEKGLIDVNFQSQFIEVSLSQNKTPELFKEKSEILIELKLIPSAIEINPGHMRVVRRRCVREHHDHPHGTESGAVKGGLKGLIEGDQDTFDRNYFTGIGYASMAIEVQYDLNIQLLSY